MLVSVVGSQRTTLRACLQDLEKQRREPARKLMAWDVFVRSRLVRCDDGPAVTEAELGISAVAGTWQVTRGSL